MLTYLNEIWKCRYFWMSLVRMDLRTRYRRSILGVGWSLLQPLAMTCVFYVAFQHFIRFQGSDYIAYLLTGMVAWNFILNSALQGCQCFFQGEAYIRQCPLPLAIYPLRTSLGTLFHFFMGLCVMTAVCAVMRGIPGGAALFSLVPTVLLLFIFCWSLTVMCGTFNVYFNDTQHLAEVLFQILFYLTPIIYRIDDLGRHRLAALLRWSPIVAFLDLIREPLMNHAVPTPAQYGYAVAIVVVMATSAAFLLGRLQKKLIFHL